MNSIMKYISRIHRCFRQWQSDKMNIHGLNGVQQNYLFHIAHQPGISQEQLSDHIMVNKSNVARQLSTLENEGWITRQTSAQDKRVYEVYPTEKTLNMMPEIINLMRVVTKPLPGPMPRKSSPSLLTCDERSSGALQVLPSSSEYLIIRYVVR